ncbi:MAG: hypothetical protein C4523_10940 [Myxococcales bacterium]|nr:MAG: hypothetical protein C4523_10940 [Myxococcales bacterium]
MTTIDEYQSRFAGYRSLMPRRMRNILLVSTLYDAFILEEDSSLSEQIWNQYVGMRLTEPPVVKRVSSAQTALDAIQNGQIDLVLLMTRLSDSDPFILAEQAKQLQPDLPIVLLVSDPAELSRIPPYPERRFIDNVFLWNNDPQTLLAIIKLVEDRENVDHDTQTGQVRAIIMVEDSVEHYSSFLPLMYTVIMNLTRSLMDDGFNDLHKQLRMRSRAKVLLAESYEDAIALYKKYRRYVLGVISDVRFWRDGVKNADAGFDLTKEIKDDQNDIPVVLHSAEAENAWRAFSLGASFLDKNSPSLLNDLREFLVNQMGFGDFVFRDLDGREIARARNVYDLLENLKTIPIASLIWHAERNHISNWLMARTEVTIADQLRPRRVSDFAEHEKVREYIVGVISKVLAARQSDIVAEYSPRRRFHQGSFAHVGQGSLGGKGRGIAFVRFLASRVKFQEHFPEVKIDVPETLVIGAGEFDAFLDENGLRRFAIECDDVHELAKRFMKGSIRKDLVDNLRYYISKNDRPLAVRSSSILEDSHLQPFAGLYATYMLPNNVTSESARLDRLLQAIKMVWASTFGPNPKAYFAATSHRIEQEKMAVVIQELIGKNHSGYYYPTFSGVGQSYNYYPFGPLTPEEGVAHVGLGLGKFVVEGGSVLRFCPSQPQVLPQFASPRDWLDNSQRQFYALKMDAGTAFVGMDPDDTLSLLDLARAEQDGELEMIASVYSPHDEVIRDSLSLQGPRLITFSGLLKYREFPLCEILQELFAVFSGAMGCPVELEFVVNLNKPPRKSEFYILQIRPLISRGERQAVAIDEHDSAAAWLYTGMALGNSKFTDIQDVVYVRPETFDRRNLGRIAESVGQFNKTLVETGRPYVLIGFGRWGSSDPWLGIGVGWAQISGARVMVEASLPDFRIDPSQGSHFFQNITSLGVGYLSVGHGKDDGFIDWSWLAEQPTVREQDGVRHVRLERPITVKIDGHARRAVALKP